MNGTSLADLAIRACGTMSMELRALKEDGFRDTEHLLLTAPGLRQGPTEPERRPPARMARAKEQVNKVIVVFGGAFCHVNA